MSTTLKIKATYKGGVFIPYERVHLNEGERVEIEICKKEGRIISLRGLWKKVDIGEEDIKEAKQLWEAGIRKQMNILAEDNGK